MKTVIVGIGTLILSIFVCLCVQDVKTYQRYNQDLRFVCEELSATGTLYNDKNEFSEGRMVFNQVEANKAIKEQLKSMLRTDDSLSPLHNSYWTEQIQLYTYFVDDSNTAFPYLFTDPITGYTKTLTSPAVIVTINAGVGKFSFPAILSPGPSIRSASHEWEDY